MNYKILADRVRFFKVDAKGVKCMSKVLKEIKQEGIVEGEERRTIKIAEKMLKETNLPYETISDIVNLPIERIKSLDETNHFKRE